MNAISRFYNLGKLGQAGDAVTVETSAEERAALAKAADVLEVPAFTAKVVLKRTAPDRFALQYDVSASVVQACVVTLEPLTARIEKSFLRELHHAAHLRRDIKEILVVPGEDEIPEEIESLHYDLGGALEEEFILALDPYPRAPGVEFQPPEGMDQPPESPFAVLKGLKSGE